nr:hypothetical protein [Nitrosomonas nitrosa]
MKNKCLFHNINKSTEERRECQTLSQAIKNSNIRAHLTAKIAGFFIIFCLSGEKSAERMLSPVIKWVKNSKLRLVS